MQASQKPVRKPMLSSLKKISTDSYDKKLQKCQIFYRFHIASMYRQLKIPIYQKLMQLRKENKEERIPQVKKTTEEAVEGLYKYAIMNSKYRHREKMRFERTPLFKYLKYDFARLRELLKTKKFMKNYQDLHDEDQSDQDTQKKIQYDVDPGFSEQTIANYKKKNNIQGKIIIALGYEDLKTCLVEEYNWSVNPDMKSDIYDLKFMSKKKHIDYVNLLDKQYVNHFEENKNITAKFGLCRNIRNIASQCKDPNLHFPKCYDVNDVAELEDFYEDFKCSLVKSVLYQVVKSEGKVCKDQIDMVKLAMEIAQRELLPFDKKVDLITKGKPLAVTLKQFQYLSTWKQAQKGEQLLEQQLLKKVTFLYQQLKTVDPQWSLNCDNVWIVKPASMSRGRGIKTFNCLSEIFDYIVGCQISWVIQKYIERPLIIRRKKFDIRQWVLWTDFKPIRIWMYDQCYIRFCASIYEADNLKDRKIHLTNNSVTKGINSQNDGIEGNMMTEATFSHELEQLYGKQIFKSVIKPQMKQMIRGSLESVVENVLYRKNSFEILGYDFMIDEELKVWLIEVNSSPTMQKSTAVTTELVKKGMRDLGMVIENYITKGKQYKANNPKQHYGHWKLITLSDDS